MLPELRLQMSRVQHCCGHPEDETKTQSKAKPSESQGNRKDAPGETTLNLWTFSYMDPYNALLVKPV